MPVKNLKNIYFPPYTFLHYFKDSFLNHAQNPHPNPLPKGEGVAIPSPTVPELVEGGEG